MIETLQLLADTSMDGQILPINLRCYWQVVKKAHELFIHLIVVVLQALLAEVKVFCARARFMVASEHDDIFLPLDLHGTDVCYDFGPVHAPVHVVSHEDNFLNASTVSLDFLQHVEQVV